MIQQRTNKKESKGKYLIYAVSLLSAVLVILLAVVIRYSIYYHSSVFHGTEAIRQLVGGGITSASDREKLKKRQDMLCQSQTEYPDMVAWLVIPGTSIDYPVMHGDNVYYGSHSYDGQRDVYGTPYLRAENAPDFSDSVSIVYGRDMANGTMFGGLDAFLRKETFDKVTEGILITADGMYHLSILACGDQSGDLVDDHIAGSDVDGAAQLYASAQQKRGDGLAADGRYLILSNGADGKLGKNCVLISQMTPWTQ